MSMEVYGQDDKVVVVKCYEYDHYIAGHGKGRKLAWQQEFVATNIDDLLAEYEILNYMYEPLKNKITYEVWKHE